VTTFYAQTGTDDREGNDGEKEKTRESEKDLDSQIPQKTKKLQL
jgi:hypothetical protein